MTETYTLKNATFTLEVPDTVEERAAHVRLMTDASLDALLDSALAQWAYRRGARKENDGKSFTLQDAVADMRAAGTRVSNKLALAFALPDAPERVDYDAANAYLLRECGAKATEEARDAAVQVLADKLRAGGIEVAPDALDPEVAAAENAATLAWLKRCDVLRKQHAVAEAARLAKLEAARAERAALKVATDSLL